MSNPWIILFTTWFGSSLLGLLLVITEDPKQVWKNLKDEPYQFFGCILILIFGGFFTLGSGFAIRFLIPAMNRANERSKQMAKEHARKLREAEGWVQLELFPED